MFFHLPLIFLANSTNCDLDIFVFVSFPDRRRASSAAMNFLCFSLTLGMKQFLVMLLHVGSDCVLKVFLRGVIFPPFVGEFPVARTEDENSDVFGIRLGVYREEMIGLEREAIFEPADLESERVIQNGNRAAGRVVCIRRIARFPNSLSIADVSHRCRICLEKITKIEKMSRGFISSQVRRPSPTGFCAGFPIVLSMTTFHCFLVTDRCRLLIPRRRESMLRLRLGIGLVRT